MRDGLFTVLAAIGGGVVSAILARLIYGGIKGAYRLRAIMERNGSKPNPYTNERAARNYQDGVECGMSDDPMERIVAVALQEAGIEFVRDRGGENPSGLDFKLANGVEIEVKRFHSPRVAEQMARAENVIVAQGADAVRWLASLIAQGTSAGTAETRRGSGRKTAGPVGTADAP